MSSVEAIANKLNQVSGILTEMQQNGSAESMGAVLNDLGQLDVELKNAQAQITSETSDSVRQELVKCRMALSGMLNLVSDIRSETAERYRQVLGEQKTSFEEMDESRQQSSYPEAYQQRQMFRQMDMVSSQLHQLNSAMMDAGYQAGRGKQNESEATYAENIPDNFTSGTDSTSYS